MDLEKSQVGMISKRDQGVIGELTLSTNTILTLGLEGIENKALVMSDGEDIVDGLKGDNIL